MKKLLSLPPNLVESFHDITTYDRKEWFCTHDPIDRKLGSGGGTVWLLTQCYLNETDNKRFDTDTFSRWLSSEKRILIHAGGQSRRLPAYAPSGKILTPIPLEKNVRGQKLSQNLLDLQVPLYEQIMQNAPKGLHTMIVSGDVLIRTSQQLLPIPDADIVCFGLLQEPEVATNHGVFVAKKETPTVMEYMLQKPKIEQIKALSKNHYLLTDIGIWLLNDNAIRALFGEAKQGEDITEYDLYGTFGCALGHNPSKKNPQLSHLKIAVQPLPGGEFHHFGTSHELLSSSLNLQREKAQDKQSIFLQHCICKADLNTDNHNIWIENSFIGKHWKFSYNNIVTGAPENDWELTLEANECIDFVPLNNAGWAVRRYGFYDKFEGELQQKALFPIFDSFQALDSFMKGSAETRKVSAEELSTLANLRRLCNQRKEYDLYWREKLRKEEADLFYSADLEDTAAQYNSTLHTMPDPICDTAPILHKIADAMWRSRLTVNKHREKDEQKAFELLKDTIHSSTKNEKVLPRRTVVEDQMVLGHSSVRIDLAGGWTDTPPYCIFEGGNVVNIAINLNQDPPLKTFIKPRKDCRIIIRSIDLGVEEVIENFEDLADFQHIGSAFSIPKAALALCGLLPEYCKECYASLKQQLETLGGFELSLIAAIPAGSGLGTSSILGANVLGTLNDYFGLNWSKEELSHRTLLLEQLIGTGGGWQDQFGGIFPGIKLLQTDKGLIQTPQITSLSDRLFTSPEYKACHLLYYTGITRKAKNILGEIVKRMFLNQHEQIELLRRMKQHALDMANTIQNGDLKQLGTLVSRTWQQNKALDSGTNPSEIAQLIALIHDYCYGYKLPGAGGGGYLYMIAKDPDAAQRIKLLLHEHALNHRARMVTMSINQDGFKSYRS